MPKIDRTVVYLQRTREQDKAKRFQFYLSSPYGEGANTASPFNIDLEDDPFSALAGEEPDGEPCVRMFGERLYKVLMEHEAVARRLETILESTLKSDKGPIYFHVGPLLDDDLPWETLYCEQRKFVALDSRFPIAHLHDVNSHGSRGTDYTLITPLKITLVLSGPPIKRSRSESLEARSGRSEEQTKSETLLEWESLWAKLCNPSPELKLEIQVLTSDPDVVREVRHLEKDWVKAFPIEDGPTLLQAIKRFGPRFLHFYCPCSVGGELEIPTQSDWSGIVQDTSSCSIRLSAPKLREKADPTESIWVVTLNCGLDLPGETAATPNTKAPRTLARQLIHNAFPVAVTVRTSVNATRARSMFAQFYMDAMDMIENVPADGKAHHIEWASALLEARSKLMVQEHKHEDDDLRAYCRHWTTPVLYARPEPFLVSRPRSGSDIDFRQASEVRTLIDVLDKLKADGSKPSPDEREALAKIAARIAELTELR